jgi:hypothetical protein
MHVTGTIPMPSTLDLPNTISDLLDLLLKTPVQSMGFIIAGT